MNASRFIEVKTGAPEKEIRVCSWAGCPREVTGLRCPKHRGEPEPGSSNPPPPGFLQANRARD